MFGVQVHPQASQRHGVLRLAAGRVVEPSQAKIRCRATAIRIERGTGQRRIVGEELMAKTLTLGGPVSRAVRKNPRAIGWQHSI